MPLVKIRNALLEDSDRFHALKSHKRLLYCMAEFCPVEVLSFLCETLLMYNPGPEGMLNDKYMVPVLLALVRRNVW